MLTDLPHAHRNCLAGVKVLKLIDLKADHVQTNQECGTIPLS